MPETPSQEIIKSSTVFETDVRGRKIEVKRMKTLDRLRFFEIIGAENSKNERYLGVASLAFCIVSIDGEPVPRPKSKLALEALVDRLDDDGYDAVAKAISENFMPDADDKPPDQERDAIKNG